jgi:hypothetical protein
MVGLGRSKTRGPAPPKVLGCLRPAFNGVAYHNLGARAHASYSALVCCNGGLIRGRTRDQTLYTSGLTFFTVGFGDVSPRTSLAKLIAVAEAGTGFGFIAVVIGYLPVLYQLYARREIHVMQLDARAGSPPCALMLLCRHA